MTLSLEQLSARMRQGEDIPLSDTARIALALSIPSILEQLVVTAMEYIDAAMVGHIGAEATAAIGIVSSSTWLLHGILVGLYTAFSIQIAQYLGADRQQDARGVLRQSMLFNLILGLGAAAGFALNQLEIYFHSRSKRMSLSVAFVLLTVGLSMVSFKVGPIHCSFSLLLVCMMTGTVFCNICPTSDELMDRLDRWVSPVNILFFVLSGAELDLNILANPMVLLIGAVYIASRSLGKISGSYVSCKATRCSEKIQKYLGITLLPQAGVALGMAAEAAELSDGHMVRNVVLFSVLVYELVGPTLAKISLTAAGEIIPEGRTSARTTNKPEEPVSVE